MHQVRKYLTHPFGAFFIFNTVILIILLIFNQYNLVHRLLVRYILTEKESLMICSKQPNSFLMK
jgi:hypothetical protein